MTKVMSAPGYVHGYSPGEARRLGDQADTLAGLLHAGTSYPAGSRVLEVGCGVGAQTVHLVAGSPAARLTAVDISAASLARARAAVAASAPGAVVRWQQADLFDLPFADGAFDHLFVCFVLEHLADPAAAAAGLRRVLAPGGTITVIEGDHGSAFFHPDSPAARAAIGCLVALQAAAGGNGLLGRQLQPLLAAAGYRDIAGHAPDGVRRPDPPGAGRGVHPEHVHGHGRRGAGRGGGRGADDRGRIRPGPGGPAPDRGRDLPLHLRQGDRGPPGR